MAVISVSCQSVYQHECIEPYRAREPYLSVDKRKRHRYVLYVHTSKAGFAVHLQLSQPAAASCTVKYMQRELVRNKTEIRHSIIIGSIRLGPRSLTELLIGYR